MRWPCEETKYLFVSQNVRLAEARATPSTDCMAPVTPSNISAFSLSDTANGSSSCGVS